MSERMIVRRNSVFSFLSSATRLLANLLMFVGIARYFGAGVFGQFTTAHTYFTFFLYISDFGTDLLLATEVARNRMESVQIARRILSMKIVFSTLAMAAMVVTAMISGLQEETSTLMWVLAAGIPANAFCAYIYAFYKGHDAMHHEAKNTFIQNVSLLIALIVLGLMGATPTVVAFVFIASRFFGATLLIFQVTRSYGATLFTPQASGVLKTFWLALPYGVNLLFAAMLFQLDTLLLAHWKGEQVVGLYQSVVKIIALVLILPDVITNALLPVLTRLKVEDQLRWQKLSFLLTKSMFCLAIPFSVMFAFGNVTILHVVYGGNFSAAGPVLKIFAITLLVRFAAEPFALVLTTANQQHQRMWIIVIVTMFNLLVNSYAIPHFGAIGAAVVSLVSNLLAGILYIARASRFWVSPKSLLSGSLIILAIAGAALMPIEVIESRNVLTIVLLSAMAIPTVLFLLGFSVEEKRMVLSLFARTAG